MTNIEQRLIDIIKDYSKIDFDIVPEMDLIFDLGFDSLSFTELIVA
jgi:acyl carrier protein